ncbi:MAG: GIY-YIG nuclease family protein [Saprospiraceae bacterium]|nr:GIY-YIG nuclease family protein [Bacteroidia bacterium]NNK89142.1 GIY-YIG nuclease family protein [Saprospiraceae bacterium]
MNFHVYILYSFSRNLFYVGSTKNIHQRIYNHNHSLKGFTFPGKPWQLIWSTLKSSRQEAEILEKKLKNISRLKKISFMRKYPEGIHNNETLHEIIEI